jgi:hypothetical protein
MLRCGSCGGTLSGERHVKRSGLTFTYYRCGHRKLGKPRCDERAPREEAVVEGVLDVFGQLALTPNIAAWTLDAIDVLATRGRADAEAERKRVAEELESVKRQTSDLTDILLERLISTDDFRARKSGLDEKRIDLERRLADPTGGLEAWQHEITNAVTTATDITGVFASASNTERRELFARISQNCIVSDGKATPTLKILFSALAKVPRDVSLPKVTSQNRRRLVEGALATTKNAPVAGSRLGAFPRWWTSLEDFRTFASHERGRDSPSDHRRAA